MPEAGALSKKLSSSSVCPILLGIEPSDLSGPLSQFQATKFDKDDVRSLVATINEHLGDEKLEGHVLNSVFEKWWPELESKVSRIISADAEPATELRSDREILEEVLGLIRTGASASGRKSALPTKLERRLLDFLNSFVGVFDHDWDFSKNLLFDPEWAKIFIDDACTFLNPGVDDESNNWANRGALLATYRRLTEALREIGYHHAGMGFFENIEITESDDH